MLPSGEKSRPVILPLWHLVRASRWPVTTSNHAKLPSPKPSTSNRPSAQKASQPSKSKEQRFVHVLQSQTVTLTRIKPKESAARSKSSSFEKDRPPRGPVPGQRLVTRLAE